MNKINPSLLYCRVHSLLKTDLLLLIYATLFVVKPIIVRCNCILRKTVMYDGSNLKVLFENRNKHRIGYRIFFTISCWITFSKIWWILHGIYYFSHDYHVITNYLKRMIDRYNRVLCIVLKLIINFSCKLSLVQIRLALLTVPLVDAQCPTFAAGEPPV